MANRFSALALLLVAAALNASEGGHHDHGPVDLGKLGKVTFETTCGKAQADFNRALAMMHSFWYVEAEKAFQKIAKNHPQCAMAQWGVAMANYHPIWAPPTPDELRRGRTAAEAAAASKAGDSRERAFIGAVNAFYADSDTVDHPTRALRYEKAMADVAAKHPKDREASILYALSLLGTASANDKTYAKQKQAADILNRILPAEPEHPGVAHYIIHSFDYPQLAAAALPAARAYAKIAPGSPHALHMPSHIFTRLGLWEESIASNTASAEKARRYIRQINPDAVSPDELHAIDYLVYARLQQANDEKAKELTDTLLKAAEKERGDGPFMVAYAYAAVPARYLLERRQWKEAAQLEVRPANFPWKNIPYAEALIVFAKAIGGARSGDLNVAKAATDRLGQLRQALLDQKNKYWAEQVEVQWLAAQAALAQSAGFRGEALRLMREAADLEDTTEKHPVTPGVIIPARELLAEMLLDDGRADEALVEVEKVLMVAPGRYNAELLAARAAEKAANTQKARAHYQALVTLAGNSSRPELAAARSFVSQK